MSRTLQPPPDSGTVALGRTLPSLIDEAAERNPNPRAFHRRTEQGWEPLSTAGFRTRSQHLALALRDLGLDRGDRVALLAHSDVGFIVADMACLMAGLVDVPIHVTHTGPAMRHILEGSEARALIVSDRALLDRVRAALDQLNDLEWIVFIDESAEAASPAPPPDRIRRTTVANLEARGEELHDAEPGRIDALKAEIDAQDLATLMYTSGTTGQPKGVMLTHENISSNVIASITGLTTYLRGDDEISLSFLPLSHIFMRTLQYGAMWFGTRVHFSDPETLSEDFQSVRPTFLATVPRVLEKAYERIRARGEELDGPSRWIFDWAMGLAEDFDVSRAPSSWEGLQLGVADRLVFSKWRDGLGGRIRTVIVGGAALRPELANRFGAAGIHVLQGYGLTETSPVIAFNRPARNRAGTVGPVIAGTEARIADDGEILVRGPHIMRGYWKQPDATEEAIDDDGWFATGDLGDATDDGFLIVTGRKKDLFKLSTGKYVTPEALEQALEAAAWVEHALVVGEAEKYCAALVFVSREALAEHLAADASGESPDGESLRNDEHAVARALKRDDVREAIRAAIREAQRGLPTWSQARRVALVPDELTREDGMLTPKLSKQRPRVREAYEREVQALYDRNDEPLEGATILDVTKT